MADDTEKEEFTAPALKGMTQEDRDKINGMDYEATRDNLRAIVTKLERGGLSLEDSLRYWQIGEALAARAQSYLEQVRAQLNAAQEQQQAGAQHAGTQ